MENARAIADNLRDLSVLACDPWRVDGTITRTLHVLSAAIPCALISLFDSDDAELHLRTCHGKLAHDGLQGLVLRLSDFPSLGTIVRVGIPRTLVAQPTDDEARLYAELTRLPLPYSSIVVPVRVDGRAPLLLRIDGDATHRYDSDLETIATLHGQLVGMAIAAAERTQALEQMRQQLSEEQQFWITPEGSTAPSMLDSSQSEAMQQTIAAARQVAQTDVSVLIRGETGTGKSLLANAIHDWSPRYDMPFVQMNCAALPSELIESELFGHVKGAFSGASRDRPGRFRAADGGTLLLDEIGELSPALQAKLLRVLQEQSFLPVGSDNTVRVDVRVIAATNAQIESAVAKGHFRQDLYYRLNVFPLALPPLRERLVDIPMLANAILDQIHARTGNGPWTLDAGEIARLQSHDWPGNIRELINVLERARILCSDHRLSVPLPAGDNTTDLPAPAWPTLDDHVRRYIRRVLEKTRGKIYGVGGAAQLLGLPPSTLQSKMKRLGLHRRPAAAPLSEAADATPNGR